MSLPETSPLETPIGPAGMVTDAHWLTAEVVDQGQLAEGTYRLRLRCPEVARAIRPGQFFMVRPVDGTDPLLGRPFALYDTVDGPDGRPESIEFVYHVIGKLTGRLSSFAGGERLELWGPLGNGFPRPRVRHLCYVGGGIGYTPVMAVARQALADRRYGTSHSAEEPTAEQVTLLYGARSAAFLADLTDLRRLGERLAIQVATDDGSAGHHGYVTDLLQQTLDSRHGPQAVFCCGPEPMMHAVARQCERAGVDCWLSLESPMACGFGACFSCVTRVKTDETPGWDYRRTCIEGPVFRSRDLWID